MKHVIALLFFPLLILTSCSSDDGGGPSTPEAPIVFEANRLGPDGQTVEWSLPATSAEMDLFTIEITATNASTGEVFRFTLPNNGEATYFSQNTSNSQGEAEYITSGDDTLTSVYASNNAYTLVEITEIDTVSKRMKGTFGSGVFDADDASVFYIFQEGVFENVPYTETEFTFGETTLTATVNGSAFVADFTFSLESQNTLAISGSTLTGESLQISFPTSLAPGTYGLGTSSANPTHSGTYSTGGNSALANTGTLVITSNNAATSTVVGTFNFQATTFPPNPVTYSITAGAFTAEY